MEGKGFLNDLQIGFKKGHRVADHVLVLQTLIAQAKKKRRPLHAAFIDLKQAYDRVDRKKLYKKLIKAGAPLKLIKTIMSQYGNLEYCILTPGGRTPYFNTLIGLKQGDTMSPLLFNFFIMDILFDFVNIVSAPTIQGVPVSILMFADDCVILSESGAGLQRGLCLMGLL